MSEAAHRFDDLPDETKEFLTNLRPDEVGTLKDGIKLVTAIRTVGIFAKWLIVGILGLFVGMMMFLESAQKLLAWFRG